MHQAIKGALIGSALGAGVAAFQAKGRTAETGEAAPTGLPAPAKGALAGAAAGGLVGTFLDRRAQKAAADAAQVGGRKARKLAARAQPYLASAVETVNDELESAQHFVQTTWLPAMSSAAEKAIDALGDVVHDAEPYLDDLSRRARKAGKKAQKRSSKATKQARKQAEGLAKAAAKRPEYRWLAEAARVAAEDAQPKVKRLAAQASEALDHAAEVARPAAGSALDAAKARAELAKAKAAQLAA